jgi:hypothetical protein
VFPLSSSLKHSTFPAASTHRAAAVSKKGCGRLGGDLEEGEGLEKKRERSLMREKKHRREEFSQTHAHSGGATDKAAGERAQQGSAHARAGKEGCVVGGPRERGGAETGASERRAAVLDARLTSFSSTTNPSIPLPPAMIFFFPGNNTKDKINATETHTLHTAL